MTYEFEIEKMIELKDGGVELIITMDEKTKTYLINYAILDILKNQLNYVEELHKQEYK